MGVIRDANVETLEYLKKSVERMRETVWRHPDNLRVEILLAADRIAEDTAKLEADLIASGYLPVAANVA